MLVSKYVSKVSVLITSLYLPLPCESKPITIAGLTKSSSNNLYLK